jgi:sporulation protein YlmC with PRC-barrel domain
LSKPQKEKSVTKDKLVGMTVIDSDGNIVGTVKDVGFTVGKAGISLSIEDKDGDIRDIAWDNIQGAGDYVLLKPSAAQPESAAQPAQAAQAAQSSQPECQTCGDPLSYIQQYQRWYCYKCKKYA